MQRIHSVSFELYDFLPFFLQTNFREFCKVCGEILLGLGHTLKMLMGRRCLDKVDGIKIVNISAERSYYYQIGEMSNDSC